MSDLYKNKNIFFTFLILYLSLIFGFYFDENLNYGAQGDWIYTDLPPIIDLSNNFKETLLNYESYGHRHSPVYLIFLSFFKKIGFPVDIIRFLHLNISIFLIYIFFKCLSLKFKEIDKTILLLLAFSIFLSPTFRSLAIWPSSRIAGLIFFLFSIYEFIKYQQNKSNISLWKNIVYLILSSYISPNFSLFIFYFLYHYSKSHKLSYLILICLICLILSFPALYYLFYLDINFLTAGTPGLDENNPIGLNFNFSNKILIISSIILFQCIPFLINKNILIKILNFFKENIIAILAFLSLNIVFFDYSMQYTGGGIFFQISNYLVKNNLIFYFFCFLSIGLIWYFSKRNYNNLLIFIILIASNIQNTIYHKYYDPLLMILLFTLINTDLSKAFLRNKINVIYPYIFYLIFIFMRIIKNFIYINY